MAVLTQKIGWIFAGGVLLGVRPARIGSAGDDAERQHYHHGDEVQVEPEQLTHMDRAQRVREQRLREIEAAVGHHQTAAEPGLRLAGGRQGLVDDGAEQDDLQQDGNVAHGLDVDRHQARHDPVLGQPENAGDHADHRGKRAAEHRDQQRVQDADHGGTGVGRARGVFDQTLVDVVGGGLGEKAEAELFAERLEIADRVADQPAEEQHQEEEGDDLDGVAPIAGIGEQHAEAEALGCCG